MVKPFFIRNGVIYWQNEQEVYSLCDENMRLTANNKPARPRDTCEKIYADMAGSKLTPGTKLKPIHELAKQYKVSYLTAQKAVKMLQEDGVVISRRGDGTYVANISAKNTNGGRQEVPPEPEAVSIGPLKKAVPAGPQTSIKAVTEISIGIIMPYWMSDQGAMAFHRITKGFLNRIDKHRWRVEMINNAYHEAALPDFVEKIVAQNLNGIFWVAPQPEHQMNIMRLIDRGVATVAAGRSFPDLPLKSFFTDMTDLAEKMVDYCLKKNHKKIILLTGLTEGQEADANSVTIVTEMRKALKAKGIELPDSNIGQAAIFTHENKVLEILARHFLLQHPDADTIISYHEEFFPIIAELDEQNFWPNSENMIIMDVNGEFAFNRNRIGRIPVTRIGLPLENMGAASAREFEKLWLDQSVNHKVDLSVRLISPECLDSQ